MNDFEFYTLMASALNLLLIIVGFGFAAVQIHAAKRELTAIKQSHVENHDWNRRVAAQEALRAYNYSLLSSPLQSSFNYLNTSDSFSITEIENKFENESSLQSDLHQLLNYYEGLARGINQAIFDEEVVKTARCNAMIKCERAFRNYIEQRRSSYNVRAWIELSNIVDRWNSESHGVLLRKITGDSDSK